MKTTNRITTLVLLLSLFLPACRKSEKTPAEPGTETVTIGALLSLTGNWSSLGITSKAAIELALNDVNAYMQRTGSKYRFAADISDTKLDTALAAQYIARAKDRGITFVLGPQSSAEAGAVKAFADANNMLVVSQGSTAGSLSIAGDNLFRFCPDDHVEGTAIAKTIYHQHGVRGLITVARNDAGNKGLQQATGAAFTELGGTVTAIPPYDAATTDFTSLIADIRSRITANILTYGASGTGVYLASFDEFVALFRQAAGDPVLTSVNWFGSDGVALSAALINDADAAAFAVSTHYFAPAFGLPAEAQSKWEPLSAAIQAKAGIHPDAFALATYDAVWVIALAYDASGGTPAFGTLKAAFREQADMYFGATGPTLLNEAGDRANGTFDYWGIRYANGAYEWTLTGTSE